MYRNINDRTGQSALVGYTAEQAFKQLAIYHSWTVTDATDVENRKHVDYWLTKHDIRFGIDVKARKKPSRSSSSFDDRWLWIELRNVAGNHGWLYGDAHGIAFERSHDFLIVNRESLATWLIHHSPYNPDDIVHRASLAKYKAYTRRGRNDLITRVRTADVIAHCRYTIWHKLSD